MKLIYKVLKQTMRLNFLIFPYAIFMCGHMYVQADTHICVYIYLYVCVKARGQCWVSTLFFSFFETVSLNEAVACLFE